FDAGKLAEGMPIRYLGIDIGQIQTLELITARNEVQAKAVLYPAVPLVEGVDFFNELERAIRESYPKPKMMILGFPSNPTAQCVEL
ncbi:MlaD family protein, partial [Salmonella enterica subsp. enterica serovar Kentucky]|nr:MlaD family protein [Salmonella enterica subsp. enterica serovar Kentucky]